MAVFNELKSIAKVLQEVGKIELYQRIIDVSEKLREMQTRIDELEADNKELRSKLKIKGNLVPENNMYWLEKEERRDGPFCTNCWDSEEILMRLHKSDSHGGIQCPKCKIWTVDPRAQQFRPINHHRNRAI
jgi:hypothetical protein